MRLSGVRNTLLPRAVQIEPAPRPMLVDREGAQAATPPDSDQSPVQSPVFGRPRPVDLALLAIAGLVWFAPTPLLVFGFPLLGAFMWRRSRALREAASTRLDLPVALLMGMGVLALLPSPDLETSLARLLGVWLGGAVFHAVFDVIISERRLWTAVAALATLGILVALVGLVGTDWSAVNGVRLPIYDVLPRLITFLPHSLEGGLHPTKLAAALAMLLPLPTAVMLFTPGRLLRAYWGAGAALMAFTLLLTQSSSGLIAGAAALVALAAARSAGFRRLLPLIAAAIVALVLWIGPLTVAQQVLSLVPIAGTPGTLDNHLAVWSLALRLVEQSPLLGIGIGTFPLAARAAAPLAVETIAVDVPHAHNLYLQFALDLGLPGLALFLVLLGGTLRLTREALRLAPIARHRGLIAGVACGLLAYLVYGITDAIGPGEKPGLFLWLLLGTLAASARVAEREHHAFGRRQSGSKSAEAPSIGSVIYVSTFEWDYHTARPQQLARALAEKLPLFYVETTGLRGVGARDLPRLLRRVHRGLSGRRRIMTGVWVFSPLVLPFHRSRLARTLNRILLRDAVRGQAMDLELANPLLLISIPTAASIDLIGHLNESASMYDCMDDLTVIPLVDPSIRDSEAELARLVDVMTAASDAQRRAKLHLRDDIVVVGQGVDAAHFNRPAPCPPDLGALPGPRLVCVGGIDDRIDFALLDEVAALRPHWSIVLIGPQLYVRAEELVRRPNVHFLGRRAYADLPGYVQHADVCLIPYRDTAWARACNPVKTLEYLAAGRAVVSSDVPAVREYQPHVRIACGPAEFVDAIESALQEESPELQRARRARAAGASWHERAETVFRLAEAAALKRVGAG